MPKLLARSVTAGLRMSRTLSSHDGQARFLTIWIASSHTAQPALKISTLRTVFIENTSFTQGYSR